MNNFLIRVDANEEIGWGHLYRCVTISKQLKKLDKKSTFLLKFYTSEVLEYLNIHTINYILLDELEPLQFNQFLNDLKEIKKIDAVILDITHSLYLNKTELLEQHISSFSEQFFTVLFSELKYQNFDCDIFISPYLGSISSVDKSERLLIGESYFILRDEFITKGQNYKVKKDINHIAITMGGSNPSNSIEIAIESVATSKFKGKCKIIMGKNASIDKKRVDQIIKESKINFDFVYEGEFSSLLLEADIVFTNSGLTKYEALFLGIPTFAFSINNNHAEIMDIFQKKTESIKHIGNINSIETIYISNQLNEFMEDHKLRDDMSKRGKKLIDAKGSERVIKKILEKYKEKVYEK